MATSYSYVVGSGDRRQYIAVTSSALYDNTRGPGLVDGDTANTAAFFGGGSVAGLYIRFDFGSRIIVDEAKFYQSAATSHGVWKWQGSQDASAWVDIGSSFTLGGATTQTQTSLNGNAAGYRYYQIVGVSGSASSGPWLHEFEFKADDDATDPYSWYRGGTGNRVSTIAASHAGFAWGGGGGDNNLIDGVWGVQNLWWNGVPSAGAYLRWDFGAATVVSEFRWLQSSSASHGTWKVQGSNNASAWTDLGGSFVLGGSTAQAISTGGNSAGFRYYQLAWASGALDPGPFLYEVQFRTGVAVAPLTPGSGMWGDAVPGYNIWGGEGAQAPPPDQTIQLSGIASAEALGSISIATAATLALAGIPSGEALGSITITGPGASVISVVGIPSGEALGSISLAAAAVLALAGIPSEEALGALVLSGAAALSLAGIPSGEAMGALVVVSVSTIQLAGIASAEAFGSIALVLTPAAIRPYGRTSLVPIPFGMVSVERSPVGELMLVAIPAGRVVR